MEKPKHRLPGIRWFPVAEVLIVATVFWSIICLDVLTNIASNVLFGSQTLVAALGAVRLGDEFEQQYRKTAGDKRPKAEAKAGPAGGVPAPSGVPAGAGAEAVSGQTARPQSETSSTDSSGAYCRPQYWCPERS